MCTSIHTLTVNVEEGICRVRGCYREININILQCTVQHDKQMIKTGDDVIVPGVFNMELAIRNDFLRF